jgi:hypothetical protein
MAALAGRGHKGKAAPIFLAEPLTVSPRGRSFQWNGLGSLLMGFYFVKVIFTALVVLAITAFYKQVGAFWRGARSLWRK